MVRLLAALIVWTLALPAWAAPPDSSPWRYSPPDATALVGIQWGHLRKTLSDALLRSELEDFGLPSAAAQELLKSVDGIYLSAGAADPAKGRKDAPLLITLKGRFNLGDLRAMALSAKLTVRPYRFAEILIPAGAGPQDMVIALVNAETVLLADPRDLRHALDQSGAGATARADNPLFEQADRMMDAYDAWAVAYLNPGPGAALGDAEGLAGGVVWEDGLQAKLRLSTPGAPAAAQLASTLTERFRRAGSTAGRKRAGAVNVWSLMQVTPDQKDVVITLDLDAQQFSHSGEQLQTVLTSLMPTPGSAPPAPAVRAQAVPVAAPGIATASTPLAAKPAPAAESAPKEARPPQVIRIYGLEEGTREIRLPE